MRYKILILVPVAILLIFLSLYWFIPMYIFHLQSDNMLTISYVCTLGLKPTFSADPRTVYNGTHFMDMFTCEWKPNIRINSADGQRRILESSGCDGIKLLTERDGWLYISKQNEGFAERKLALCELVDQIERARNQTGSSEN